MICPFRVDIHFEYKTIEGSAVVKDQKEKFPPCMGEECPYYDTDWNDNGLCKRIDED